jgi:hypothetical protein
MDAVVSQAANNLLADIKIVPGINRGGSRVKGTIPRDLSALARSLQSSIYGGTAISGEAGWMLIAGQMTAGDVARFAWGGTGSDAEYARHVHYGANGVPGTYWIDVAAAGWQGYVKGAVRKARAELG